VLPGPPPNPPWGCKSREQLAAYQALRLTEDRLLVGVWCYVGVIDRLLAFYWRHNLQ
jgi:hypothetical protein